MKYLAIIISALAGIMIVTNWNTPLATAWTVAFCGWMQLCFSDSKVKNGNS